jgi:acyl-CoA thioesterase I
MEPEAAVSEKNTYVQRLNSDEAPYVLALGDSLTAGYGLSRSASFPARLEALLRETCAGAIVQNAGMSGDTTDDGLRRLPRLLSSLERKPDLAIVEFGANDLIRGVRPSRTRANLDAVIRELGSCGIQVLLATFEPPRFLGTTAAQFNGIGVELAASHGIASAPFFPPGVLGQPGLVLADGLHPNARAIEIVAKAFCLRYWQGSAAVGLKSLSRWTRPCCEERALQPDGYAPPPGAAAAPIIQSTWSCFTILDDVSHGACMLGKRRVIPTCGWISTRLDTKPVVP